MSFSDALEEAILKDYFHSGGLVYVSLHTADPGEGGAVGEQAYAEYARVAVAASPLGWSFSGHSPSKVSPVSSIDFPIPLSGGVPDSTYWGVSKSPTVGSPVGMSGPLTAPLAMTQDQIPRLTAASTVELD